MKPKKKGQQEISHFDTLNSEEKLKYLQKTWVGSNKGQSFKMELLFLKDSEKYCLKQNFEGQDIQSQSFIIDKNMKFSTEIHVKNRRGQQVKTLWHFELVPKGS